VVHPSYQPDKNYVPFEVDPSKNRQSLSMCGFHAAVRKLRIQTSQVYLEYSHASLPSLRIAVEFLLFPRSASISNLPLTETPERLG
jgi:hypothetical protein